MKYSNIFFFLGLIVCGGCIKNDLDYPRVLGNIVEFTVEGQKNVKINSANRTVLFDLEETADIKKLKILKVQLSDGASFDTELQEFIDLSKPKKIIINTYQNYDWTISAVQNIDRYVKCDNQIGDAKFDIEKKRVFIYVSENQDLRKIRIKSIKLEPKTSAVISTIGTNSENKRVEIPCRFPMELDCVLEREFDVKYKDKTIKWYLKVIKKEVNLRVEYVNAYASHALLKAQFNGKNKEKLKIEYKKASDSDWIETTDFSINGFGISADIKFLDENSGYVLRLSNGSETTDDFAFKTESTAQLYNMNFDDWYSEGKVWYPYLNGASGDKLIWDTANKGTAILGDSGTKPEDRNGGKAACIKSAILGSFFGAGTIYTGKFVRLQIPGAELSWGIPFESRPIKLVGKYRYLPTAITKFDEEHKSLNGKNDTGVIHVFLTDWDEPFHVISSEKKFVDFDNDPKIIAYNRMTVNEDTVDYKDLDLPLVYRDTKRKPKYVVIVCSSSLYGDYMTGGAGSTLWVDDFKFEY